MEIKTLSPEATKEILGDQLTFLVAYSSTGDTVIYAPEGKEPKEMSFPLEYPPNEIRGMTSTTTIRAGGKCVIYMNGRPYCIPCP